MNYTGKLKKNTVKPSQKFKDFYRRLIRYVKGASHELAEREFTTRRGAPASCCGTKSYSRASATSVICETSTESQPRHDWRGGL